MTDKPQTAAEILRAALVRIRDDDDVFEAAKDSAMWPETIARAALAAADAAPGLAGFEWRAMEGLFSACVLAVTTARHEDDCLTTADGVTATLDAIDRHLRGQR